MAMKDLKSVLEPKDETPEMEESEGEGYDTYTEELKAILGLDDAKAARLKEAIVGMMESKHMEEMGGESEEESEEEMPMKHKGGPKKKGLAIILGG